MTKSTRQRPGSKVRRDGRRNIHPKSRLISLPYGCNARLQVPFPDVEERNVSAGPFIRTISRAGGTVRKRHRSHAKRRRSRRRQVQCGNLTHQWDGNPWRTLRSPYQHRRLLERKIRRSESKFGKRGWAAKTRLGATVVVWKAFREKGRGGLLQSPPRGNWQGEVRQRRGLWQEQGTPGSLLRSRRRKLLRRLRRAREALSKREMRAEKIGRTLKKSSVHPLKQLARALNTQQFEGTVAVSDVALLRRGFKNLKPTDSRTKVCRRLISRRTAHLLNGTQAMILCGDDLQEFARYQRLREPRKFVASAPVRETLWVTSQREIDSIGGESKPGRPKRMRKAKRNLTMSLEEFWLHCDKEVARPSMEVPVGNHGETEGGTIKNPPRTPRRSPRAVTEEITFSQLSIGGKIVVATGMFTLALIGLPMILAGTRWRRRRW